MGLPFICVVEDDVEIRSFIVRRLSQEGFECWGVSRGDVLLESKRLKDIDLFIIDIMLPGMDGHQVCEKLRSLFPQTSILILSALNDPRHRIRGLREGADDYLSKPFVMDELVLRVQKLLLRKNFLATKGKSIYYWDGNRVDLSCFEAKTPKGTYVLGKKERTLLALFIEREGEVLSRNEILNAVWGQHKMPVDRSVDNLILRLRKIFEPDTNRPLYFESLRGVGYRFKGRKYYHDKARSDSMA